MMNFAGTLKPGKTRSIPCQVRLCISAGPGLEILVAMFNLLLVKRNIGKRLIGNKLLFPGIFSGQVEVGMPGAGIEIDLCAFPIVIVEGTVSW